MNSFILNDNILVIMKKVLVFGTFDVLHKGHRYVLRKAKERGKVHVVLARDETVEKLKGRKPFHTESFRKKQLEKKFNVEVVLGDKQDKLKPVRKVKPDIVLLGYDQKAFVDKLKEYAEKENVVVERLSEFKSEKYKSSKLLRNPFRYSYEKVKSWLE